MLGSNREKEKKDSDRERLVVSSNRVEEEKKERRFVDFTRCTRKTDR